MRPRPPAPPSTRPRARPDASTHPKMRARRRAVALDVGRRRRRRLNLVLALVCGVVWTLVGLRSPLLDVDRVQVAGAEHTSPQAVRSASGIGPGDPMAEADLGAATRAVGALPWIDEVRLRRMWPGTVRIVVRERRPLAAVTAPGGWARADAEGRVLDVVATAPDLPLLGGRRPVGPGDRLGRRDRDVLSTLGRLPAALQAEVDAARRGARGLELDVAGGWTVVVGDDEDLATKAEAALAVRRAADPDDGCTIDVRVATAPVLTPGGRCA